MSKPKALVAALLLATPPLSGRPAIPMLTLAAESRSMVWNGVAVAQWADLRRRSAAIGLARPGRGARRRQGAPALGRCTT